MGHPQSLEVECVPSSTSAQQQIIPFNPSYDFAGKYFEFAFRLQNEYVYNFLLQVSIQCLCTHVGQAGRRNDTTYLCCRPRFQNFLFLFVYERLITYHVSNRGGGSGWEK